jgi:hypothetical protein
MNRYLVGGLPYYIGGKGYLLCWECWSSLGDSPACRYRKVL